jgi:hypothetical protein
VYAQVMATGVGGETPGELEAGGYQSFEEGRIKHMEAIQGVVARLSDNSSKVKGWAIPVAGAFLGLSLNSHEIRLALAALIPTIAFWVVDTYYLRSERLFRALYDQVRKRDEHVEPFFMSATSREFVDRVRNGQTTSDEAVASFWKTAVRRTLALCYLSLIAGSGIIIVILLARK